MKKRTILFSAFICFAMLIAVILMQFAGQVSSVQAEIAGKEIKDYVLTGYQGYYPYHYFDSLTNATYSKDVEYYNKKGEIVSDFRAIQNDVQSMFSGKVASGNATINLSGEMLTLAQTGKYYAYASAGLLALKDKANSKLTISLSNGKTTQSATSNKVHGGGVYDPEWVETGKVFVNTTGSALNFQFSTLEGSTMWAPGEFYIFEPAVHFGIQIDSITNITTSTEVSKGALVKLEATNLLSNLEGESLIKYYKTLHAIEWEIVSGANNGQILDNYLKVGQNGGTITVRAKCLKNSNGTEYVYGAPITFTVNTATVAVSAKSNFEEGVKISGVGNSFNQNRYVNIFVEVLEGYSLLRIEDEQGAQLSHTTTSSGLYRVRLYLTNTSKIINVVLKKTISVEQIVVKDKVYDKNESAEISDIIFSNGGLSHGVSVDMTKLSAEFATFLPGDNIKVNIAGNIVLTGENSYMFEVVGKLPETYANIIKRNIVVRANDITIEYGEALPELKYEIEGEMLEGDILIGNLKTDTTGEIGIYDIEMGSLNNEYYNIEFVKGTLNRTKRKIGLSNIYVDNKTYNAKTDLEAGTLHFTQSGTFMPAHDAEIAVDGEYASKNVGRTELVLTFNIIGNDAKYYELTAETNRVYGEIVAKVLNISANSASKIYGNADPELTYSYNSSDLCNGDKISGRITRTVGESVGEYTITQGTLFAENYQIVFVPAKFVINERNLTIVADGKIKTYGNADPELTYQITSGEVLAGDELGVVLSRATGEKVGSYEIFIQTQTNQNYKISFTSANLVILKREMAVSILAENKIYDANTNCELDVYITNAVLADNISFDGYAKFESKNVGILKIKYFTESDAEIAEFTSSALSGQNLDCYEITFNVSSSARIDKREVIVKVQDNYLTKKYGEFDVGFPFTVENLADGESLFGILSRECGENVGQYAILENTLSESNNPNYKIVFDFDLTFTIIKRDLIIVVDDKLLNYGENEGEIEYYTSVETPLPSGVALADVLEGKPAREKGNNIGEYKYLIGTLALNNSSKGNYNLIFNGGVLTIIQKTLNIQIENVQKNYGSSDPVFTYTILSGESFKLNIKFVREAGENVGKYKITGILDDENFNVVINSGELEIVPAELTIKANSIIKTYGEADPKLSYYLQSGILKFNDTLGSILDGEILREAGESVGEYEITQGTLSASANYAINFIPAKFEIAPKDLFITANNVTKFYDEASDPELTYIVKGLIGGDAVSGSLEREVGNNPGEYKIQLGSLTAQNYNIVYTAGTFTIEKRKITVDINYVSKIFDGTDTVELTYTLSGNVLEGSEPVVNLSKEEGHNVGKYLITAEVIGDIYDVVVNENYFEILKRDVEITADNIEMNYGEAVPTLTYTITGDIDNSSLVVNLYRTQSVAAGSYQIYASILNGENYNVKYNEGTLTINKLKIVLKIDNFVKTYGSADPIFEYEIVSGGLVGYDVFSGAIIREEGENVGVYKIICELNNPNYEIEVNEATLTIVRKEVFLVSSVLNKVYDGTDIAYLRTPTLSGILQGDDVYFEYERDKVARFIQSGVGNAIPVVIYGGALEGSASGNYFLTYPTDLVADITNAVVEAEEQEFVKDVHILASQTNTTLKQGTTLVVLECDKDYVEELDFGTSKSVVGAYNMSLENGGVEVLETGKMTVNITPLSNGFNNVQVYRINSDGSKTLLNSKYENGVIQFETEEMGTFIVVADNDAWLNILLIVSASVLIIAVVAILVAKFRKKKKNKENAWF